MMIPTLTTEHLTLRGFSDVDSDALNKILSGQDVLQYFPTTTPSTKEGAQNMIARLLRHWDDKGYGLWAIIKSDTGELFGRAGLQYIAETDEVEVDYILGREFWGQGYATEVATASLQFGFDQLGIDQIVGIVHPENLASQRVLQKIGMIYIETTEYFGMTCQRYKKERA
jgi:[ribosomal protein S5]-alanine N-acetyltransferase